MTASHAIPRDIQDQVTRELYVPVNSMLSAISELHERLPMSASTDKDAALLLKIIEINSKELCELVQSLQCLLHSSRTATHHLSSNHTHNPD